MFKSQCDSGEGGGIRRARVEGGEGKGTKKIKMLVSGNI